MRLLKLSTTLLLFLLVSMIIISFTPKVEATLVKTFNTPALVNSNYAKNNGTTANLTVTMPQTPTSGDVLIATIGIANAGTAGVKNITQTGVTWTIVNSSRYSTYVQNDIWSGIVSSGASTSVIIGFNATSAYGNAANIREYSGLNTTSLLDKSSSAAASSNPQLTGTVNPTTQTYELWVGGVSMYTGGGNFTNPTYGFTMYGGNLTTKCTNAFLEKIVTTTGNANSSVTSTGGTEYYAGNIACFKASFYYVETQTLYENLNSNFGSLSNNNHGVNPIQYETITNNVNDLENKSMSQLKTEQISLPHNSSILVTYGINREVNDLSTIYVSLSNNKTLSFTSTELLNLYSTTNLNMSLHLTASDIIKLYLDSSNVKGISLTNHDIFNIYLSLNNLKNMTVSPYDTVTISGIINLLHSMGITTWDNLDLTDINAVQKFINTITKDDFLVTEQPELQKNMTWVETISNNLNEFKTNVKGIYLDVNDLTNVLSDFTHLRAINVILFPVLMKIQSFIVGSWNGTNIPLTTPAPSTGSGSISLALMFGSVFLIIGILFVFVIAKRRKTNETQ